MKAYFLSEKTGALFLNGVYLGMVDGFERSVELDPDENIHAEIAPSGYLPVRFFINQDFLLHPPERVNLYFTGDAVAVYAYGFLSEDQSLKVYQQIRLGGALFTVYRQGETCLRFENGQAQVIPLDDSFETCSIREIRDGYLLESETAFLLIDRKGNVLVRSEGKVLEADTTLRAEIPFHDSMGHTLVSEWQGGRLVSSSIRTHREPSPVTYALALFECALVGGDCTPYLHEKIRHKADSLREFLGDYRSVVLSDSPDRVGLVYERKPRIFDVRYYSVTVEDGKISNIQPE